MKSLALWIVPAFALALVLGGCGTLEHRPEPASSGGASKTAPTDASAEPSPSKVRPADSEFGFNLHIFGVSYHPDREGARRNKLDNELNVGLGINYRFHDDNRGKAFIEAGVYKDSGNAWAKFAGVGYQFKLGERWSLGADLLVFDSPTYNNGRVFIAPIPRLVYNFGAVKLNAVYAPRYGEQNQFEVFALFITIPFGQ